MGGWFDPLRAAELMHLEDAVKESRKTNQVLREQQRDARAQQVGMVAEGLWFSVRWDGRWLLVQVSSTAPRLVRAAAKFGESPQRWIHRDDLAAVNNRAPSLVRDGQLDVVTRDGQTHSVPYRKPSATDFQDLTDQLRTAIADHERTSTAAATPPPAAPADWYPAPDQPGWLRYWDGSTWTDHYHPPGPAPGETEG